MTKSVILSAVRTPFGKFGGAFKTIPAVDLGAEVMKAAVEKSGVSKEDIDYVVMGQVLQAGAGQIPSRQASIKAGLDWSICSETINKVCASSLRAVTLADQMVRSGDKDIVLAGGMESMSNAPFASKDMRWGNRMFNTQMIDLMVNDGLWDAYYDQHMAVNGGYGADKFEISREAQDEWALRSQQLAAKAIESGVLEEEIVSIEVPQRRGDALVISKDEAPRPNTTIEDLQRLKGLFVEGNTVTAGNAPGTNDGASAVMVASEEKAKELGIKPLATILGHAECGVETRLIASAPGHAIEKVLKENDLTVDDIDLFEINEAFAAVTLVTQKMLDIPSEKINVNGGAIAFGHPIGATGGRIIATLVHEMRRRKAKYGIAAICSGAAQGDAILIRCDY
ncbi:acetyl-CoA C-acetyltransferase [Vagococcus fluvialis]|jgi:acetyl-CoA C-acetyltransferase|uniref:acetyl-CoA C-acetyltransferase n=1 Tax=Vagococcus fluvialis TaxID=2738 RepID=UPI001A8F0E7F|nr:acetyl-CoA C-acetyltransferase [Vagococcus fluvialis]MBO0478228.1 acetyl-CoA C-acetyltransferase [Vagococcus fluvialis]MBO0483561.1 acetyl-CoA C-acetyltransferase [Vagococcus fluvialis]MBO0486499.1 acetyl-CoA C-acetyltransferase [Vagococcus fluvialis]MCM2139075.1 acetyl-CoA C-acetyltransferase [Vagococcus fluvialis]MDT2745871.1 acetyl-CoA C-acetyltransferase [Vagococcus fluvialis]